MALLTFRFSKPIHPILGIQILNCDSSNLLALILCNYIDSGNLVIGQTHPSISNLALTQHPIPQLLWLLSILRWLYCCFGPLLVIAQYVGFVFGSDNFFASFLVLQSFA